MILLLSFSAIRRIHTVNGGKDGVSTAFTGCACAAGPTGASMNARMKNTGNVQKIDFLANIRRLPS
jgi:hypothetical protein